MDKQNLFHISVHQPQIFFDLEKERFYSLNELVEKGMAKELYCSLSGKTQEIRVISSAVIPLKFYRTDCCFASTPKKLRRGNLLFPSKNGEFDYGDRYKYGSPIFQANYQENVLEITILNFFDTMKALYQGIDIATENYQKKEINLTYFDKNAEEKNQKVIFHFKEKPFSFRIPLSYFLPEVCIKESFEEIFLPQTFCEGKIDFVLYKKFENQEVNPYYHRDSNSFVTQKFTQNKRNPLESTKISREDLYKSEKGGFFLPYGYECDGKGFFWRKYFVGEDAYIESFYENYSPNIGEYVEYEMGRYGQIDFFAQFKELRENAKEGYNKKVKEIELFRYREEQEKLSESEKKEKLLNFFIENPYLELSIQDSTDAGNCESGTRNFLEKYNLKEKNNLKEIFENKDFEKIIKDKNFLRVISKKFHILEKNPESYHKKQIIR